jgi:hypothetical protein
VVAAGGLQTGTSELETVPAGALRVALDVGRRGTEVRGVRLDPGAEGEVLLEID